MATRLDFTHVFVDAAEATMGHRLAVIMLLSGCLMSGCAHTQLRWNTTNQARTLTDIYEQQVLDNLAMFVQDPNSLPSFAYPNQGGTDVVDNGAIGADTTWRRFGFDAQALKFGASRNMKEAWTLTPVHDVRRLELMRCAYQQALASAGFTTYLDGCPNCEKLQRTFYLGSPDAGYDGKKSVEPKRENDHLAYWSAATGRTTPACFSAVPWLCWGHKKPSRGDCCGKIGSYCGTYVWLAPGGQNELSKLTMVTLDYAFSLQPSRRTKDVTMFYNRNGELVAQHAERAVEVKTTVFFDTDISLEDLDKPLDPATIGKALGAEFGLDSGQITKIIEDMRKDDADSVSPDFLKTLKIPGMAAKESANKIKNVMDRLQKEREDRNRLRQIIGDPGSSPQLPPIQAPTNGFSPLPFELRQGTLVSPSS